MLEQWGYGTGVQCEGLFLRRGEEEGFWLGWGLRVIIQFDDKMILSDDTHSERVLQLKKLCERRCILYNLAVSLLCII